MAPPTRSTPGPSSRSRRRHWRGHAAATRVRRPRGWASCPSASMSTGRGSRSQLMTGCSRFVPAAAASISWSPSTPPRSQTWWVTSSPPSVSRCSDAPRSVPAASTTSSRGSPSSALARRATRLRAGHRRIRRPPWRAARAAAVVHPRFRPRRHGPLPRPGRLLARRVRLQRVRDGGRQPRTRRCGRCSPHRRRGLVVGRDRQRGSPTRLASSASTRSRRPSANSAAQ